MKAESICFIFRSFLCYRLHFLFDIIVVDINKTQIEKWNSDHLPIYEPKLDDLVRKVRNVNLFFSTEVDRAIQESDMIFVSVNTPTKLHGIGAGRAANLKNWELAARNIAKVSNGPKIVIEKSTLPVRTAHSMKRVLEANDRNIKFEILSNPEFLAEGNKILAFFSRKIIHFRFQSHFMTIVIIFFPLQSLWCKQVPQLMI